MTKNIVFIDSQVQDHAALTSTFDADTEWFVLNGDEDGVVQMQSVLSRYSGLDAIHIVCHGAPGVLYVGNTVLSSSNLPNYQGQWEAIGQSLGEAGDILLYGCSVAQGDLGLAFITRLSEITGADVAASDDPTGAVALGGDGVLEQVIGEVESGVGVMSGIEGVLAENTAPTFTVRDGVVLGPLPSWWDAEGSVALQADGKILYANRFNVNGNWEVALVRYNTDGSVDSSFAANGVAVTSVGIGFVANKVLVQDDGKILVTGDSYSKGFAIARYNTDGSLDTTFNKNGIVTTIINKGGYNERIYAAGAVVQPDGKILLVGRYFSDLTNQSSIGTDFVLVRYDIDGSLDTTFGGDGRVITDTGGAGSYDYPSCVILQTDGKILVAGTSAGFNLVRYNADGSIDTSFDGDGIVTTNLQGTPSDIWLQPDGKIVVTGYYNDSIEEGFAVVRFNIDGTLDSTFSNDGIIKTNIAFARDASYTSVLQPDGRILLGGFVTIGMYDLDFALVRYNRDGSLDTNFSDDGIVITSLSDNIDIIYSIALQSDGKIIVAGNSSLATGNSNASYMTLARYNSDGGLDDTFSPPENTLGNTLPVVNEQYSIVLNAHVQILDTELSESGNYNGGSLTLERHGGANSDDVFSAKPNGTLSTLTPSSYFAVDSITIGRVMINAAGTLTLSFNTNATQTLINKAMQQITYTNNSDAPPAKLLIDWTFNDGNTGDQGEGGAMSVTGSTTVTIWASNDHPILSNALVDQSTTANTPFSYTLPANAFIDPDGDTLTYSISMADGTGTPPWLTFNTYTGALGGTPNSSDVSSFDVRITAKDSSNSIVSDVFRLTVNPGPTLTPPDVVNFIDTSADDTFADTTGTLIGGGIDGGALTYGISGGNDNVTTVSKVGAYGVLTVAKATGAYTFVPNNTAIEGLKTNASETFTVTGTEGAVTTSASYKVNITGANDHTTFAGVLSGSVTEDGTTTASGTLTSSDRDTGDAVITAHTNTVGTYGSFNIGSNGVWAYALNNSATNVQALKAGQSVTDTFAVATAGGSSQNVVITINGANDTPSLVTPLPNQLATSGQVFSYQVPTDSFKDVDSSTLTYAATLSNGVALPTWLNFNPATRTFSGTPAAGNLGTVSVTVTASDGSLSITDTFDVVVSERPNTSPTAANVTLSTKEDTPLSASLPGSVDAESDPVTYAKASDPSQGTVSVTASGTFTYTPTANVNGSDSFSYTVTDDRGASNTYTVSLSISPVNDAPTITPLSALTFVDTAQDNIFLLEQAGQIQARDIDSTKLTYGISGGSSMGVYSTFQGTYGSLQLHTGTGAYTFYSNNAAIQGLKTNASEAFTVTVSDGELAGQAPLTIQVTGVNDAPVLHKPTADQRINASAAWNFAFDADAFTDIDGDPLSYSATLSGGSALPSWLSFDPTTRTFSGTPGAQDAGELLVTVTASDGRETPSDTFALTVAEVRRQEGTPGSDRLQSATGNDEINGGDGLDTVEYSGSAHEFTIRLDRGNRTVSISDNQGGRQGDDTLRNVERVQFGDLTLNLTVQDLAITLPEPALNRIAELYVAFFNRVPDGDGMEFWLGQYRQGKTINDIADAFYNAGVFFSDLTGYRADMSNDDFINIVYRNVLGRPEGADQDGLAFWRAELDSGRSAKGTLVSSILDAAHGSTFSDPTNPYHWVQKLLDNKLEVAKQVSVDWGVNYNSSEDSIAKGQAIAAAITPDDTSVAISLVGVVVADLV